MRIKVYVLGTLKGICKIFWDRGSNTHVFSCNRVSKFQLKGVQGLSFYDPVIRIVEKVSWQWMANELHMHTDLMSTSGFQMELDERVGMIGG